MSEERERRRKKEKEIEEVLETGRLFGRLANADPDIWQYVEREALLTGRKKHEIISDYIARAIIEREVVAKGLTMEQLLAAWDLKDQLERRLFSKVVMLATQMFGMLLQQVGELVAGIRAHQEQMISQIVEESKKKDIDYQMKMTQARMAAALLNSMMPMILSTLSKVHGSQIPVPQLQPAEQEKSEPEVEVIDE